MSTEISDPVEEVFDQIAKLTWDYLTVLADTSSDSRKIIDAHARLRDFLEDPQFMVFRRSLGDLIWTLELETVRPNWLEMGVLRDKIIFAQDPHINRDQVVLLVWALRARMELALTQDIPVIIDKLAD